MKKIKRIDKIIPSKRVRKAFYLTYELYGVQKAINFLAKHYKIRRMKIVIDGRRVGNSDEACYDDDNYTAYFKKKDFQKLNVLHEFYHHLANVKNWNINERTGEREADRYANKILKRVE